MNNKEIRNIIQQKIKKENLGLVHISFEKYDSIRITVVSEKFNKMRLMLRIDILSDIFLSLSQNELFDYHLVFNPLTNEEYSLSKKK